MRYAPIVCSLLVAGIAAGSCGAQTTVDLRTQSKSVDFSQANSTKPVKAGSALPAGCNIGELFFLTTAIPGRNIYACVAGNTWTSVAAQDLVGDTGSGGTAGLVPAPPAGSAAEGMFLKANGQWSVPMGGGNVTGPSASQDGGVAVFEGASGKLVTSGACLIDQGETLRCPNGFESASETLSGAIELFESPMNGTKSIQIAAPESLSGPYRLVLPNEAPTGSQLQFSFPVEGISHGSWVDARRPMRAIGFTLDGAGGALTTGLKSCSTVLEAGTITGWVIKTKPGSTGSAVVDVWAAQVEGYASVNSSNSIAGANKPTLSSAAINTASGLNWALSAGDEVCFNVDSASTATWLSVVLKVE